MTLGAGAGFKQAAPTGKEKIVLLMGVAKLKHSFLEGKYIYIHSDIYYIYIYSDIYFIYIYSDIYIIFTYSDIYYIYIYINLN